MKKGTFVPWFCDFYFLVFGLMVSAFFDFGLLCFDLLTDPPEGKILVIDTVKFCSRVIVVIPKGLTSETMF